MLASDPLPNTDQINSPTSVHIQNVLLKEFEEKRCKKILE